VRFLSAALPPNPPHDGYFKLTDNGKTLLNADLPTNVFTPLGPGGLAGFQFFNILTDGQIIPFLNGLTVASIADGVSFRVDYDPMARRPRPSVNERHHGGWRR
jgi:hypothetical protein